MNCVIIDDEEMSRAIIAQFITDHTELEIKEEFSSAIQAIKYFNQNEVDLVFLDIHMPDFSGFDFIQTVKNPPQVILTTSDRNFALEAFEYDCIADYLVKPISKERFSKAIEKVKEDNSNGVTRVDKLKEEQDPNDFYINIDRRLIKIDIPSIYLVEAKGDYIQLKTENKNYTVHTSLKKIEDKLPVDTFLKVHRSFIINVKKIIDIEDNSVLIKKDVIPVSRSNRPELMKRLNLL